MGGLSRVVVVVNTVEVVEEGGCVEGGSVVTGAGLVVTTVDEGAGLVVVVGGKVVGTVGMGTGTVFTVVVVVDEVEVVVVCIIVNNVLSSSSFKEVCPSTTGGWGAVDTVVHFSSTMIAGSCPIVIIKVAIEPKPSPAPNRAEPNTAFLNTVIPHTGISLPINHYESCTLREVFESMGSNVSTCTSEPSLDILECAINWPSRW